jgi:phosphate transport system permease protein
MKELTEKSAAAIFRGAAFLSAGMVLMILGFLIVFGLPPVREGRMIPLVAAMWEPGEGRYGILPMLTGTGAIASLGVLLAIPLSLGAAALIAVFAPRGWSRFFRSVFLMATGIPTVIYGFVGIFLLAPFVREFFDTGSGLCVLSASLMLAVLIAPTMTLFFVHGFDRTPRSYLSAVDALGGSDVQKLLYVILPGAWRHMIGGIALAAGRAQGDTLLALMLSGNAAQIPGGPLESARTLTAHIALVFAADHESPEFLSIFVCGAALCLFSTLTVIILRWLEAPARRQSR